MPIFLIWAYHSTSDVQPGLIFLHSSRGWQKVTLITAVTQITTATAPTPTSGGLNAVSSSHFDGLPWGNVYLCVINICMILAALCELWLCKSRFLYRVISGDVFLFYRKNILVTHLCLKKRQKFHEHTKNVPKAEKYFTVNFFHLC